MVNGESHHKVYAIIFISSLEVVSLFHMWNRCSVTKKYINRYFLSGTLELGILSKWKKVLCNVLFLYRSTALPLILQEWIWPIPPPCCSAQSWCSVTWVCTDTPRRSKLPALTPSEANRYPWVKGDINEPWFSSCSKLSCFSLISSVIVLLYTVVTGRLVYLYLWEPQGPQRLLL